MPLWAAVLGVAICAGTGQALAQRPLGIDVSSYQGGSIDWPTVKASGVTFAWAKATEGMGVNDADFVVNENNGKAAGVYIGAYHYAHPELNSPGTEASHFWSIAGNYIKADGKTIMPMLDIEAAAFSGHVGASSVSDWVNIWCTDIVQDAANAGVSVKPVIYVSACNACNFDTSVAQWGSDIADWNGQNPQSSTPWTTCTGCERWGSGVWHFWQYSDVGSVSGISGNVDLDVFNGTAATLVSTMVAIASTNSAIYYWDPQGTTGANPYTGSMTGTWENSKWSYGSTGLATPAAWVEGKAACFGVHTGLGTPAYTVTMNSSHVVAGFFDGALTPNSCDVTIQGSGTINLASGAQALDAHNSSDGSLALLRINCVIAGDGQLYPEGNGQSFLHGANTFTGGTQLGYPTVPFSGTVNFNNGSSFGTGPITLASYGNGGAVVLEGTSAVTVPNDVTVASATTNNIVGNAAGLTFSGDWSLGANLLTLGTGATAGNQTIISGAVSGTAGLKIFNAGTLVLSGVNTYTGTTTINSPAMLTIGGTGLLGSGAYSGSIVNNGTLNYNSTAAQTLSGVISGSGPLKTSNAGTLVLTAVNTYSGGTTIGSGSTLGVMADSGLGAAAAGVTLNGGCLKNNNSAPTISSSRTITLGAAGGYLDAGWAPANPLTIAARLSGSGLLYVNLDGSPVVLSNTGNNYTGNTIIGVNGPGYYPSGTAAWLKLGASNVLPNGSGFGDVCISNVWKGQLDLAGFSDTINGLWGDGLVTNTAASASSLTVGANNVSSIFAGAIKTASGSIAVTKTGAGTLTLGGASSTYNGGTTVSTGTLIAQTPGALGIGNATVASGAFLQLEDASALGAGAALTLASPSVGTVALNFSGTQTVNALYFGATQKAAGTWGASGAMHNNPAFTDAGLLNVTTGPASSTGLSLTSGSNPSTYGDPLTFTATVSGNSPGGTVQFSVDGIPAGNPVALVAGSASLAISNLTVAGSPHAITAAYSGDDNNNPSSTANPLLQTVAGATTTLALLSSQNPSSLDSNVTFTATVTSTAGTPAGNVIFLANAVPFSTNALVSGVASADAASLPSGTNSVAAEFGAQGDYLGSTNGLEQIVQTGEVVCSQTNAIVGIAQNPDGTCNLTFVGTPQAQYYVVASPDLNSPMSGWTPLTGSTNTVTNGTGLWQLTVTNSVSQQYYRSCAVSPCP